MSNASDQTSQQRVAVAAGEDLLAILRRHIDNVPTGRASADEAEEIDRELWDAVGAYGDALDDLYEEGEEESDEPDELTFTIRARYDYTVVDEKAFLSGGKGVGEAVFDLLNRAGRVIPAFEIDSLEAGSGLVTVHLNDEPLEPGDFDDAEDETDLLLVDPSERLQRIITEPMYGSRAEAEAAAKRATD